MIREITPRLFIGHWQDAAALQSNPDFIAVTVAIDSPFKSEHYFAIVDGRREDNQYEVDDAVETVNLLLLHTEKKVLVHCIAGISRSAAVVLGVLMSQGMSFVDAYKLIHEKHPDADPRLSLIEHLL